jgi:two-component system, NarL family, sensor kinase
MPGRRISIRLANLGYEERRSMAQELRESTAQELAALKINLGVIEKSGSHLGPKAQHALEECLAVADECGRQIQTLANSLHPTTIDDFGFASTLWRHMEAVANSNRLQLRFRIDDDLRRLRWSKKTEKTLSLAMHKGLEKMRLHPTSKIADVEVRWDRRFNNIVLKMIDVKTKVQRKPPQTTGRGRPASSTGIAAIMERVRQLGGQLAVKANKRTTVVTVALPLQ